jgi:hypothetical protein
MKTVWFQRGDGQLFEVEEASEAYKRLAKSTEFQAVTDEEAAEAMGQKTLSTPPPPADAAKVTDGTGDDGGAPRPAPANRRRPGRGKPKVQR